MKIALKDNPPLDWEKKYTMERRYVATRESLSGTNPQTWVPIVNAFRSSMALNTVKRRESKSRWDKCRYVINIPIITSIEY